jgi:hypothetical protein
MGQPFPRFPGALPITVSQLLASLGLSAGRAVDCADPLVHITATYADDQIALRLHGIDATLSFPAPGGYCAPAIADALRSTVIGWIERY